MHRLPAAVQASSSAPRVSAPMPQAGCPRRCCPSAVGKRSKRMRSCAQPMGAPKLKPPCGAPAAAASGTCCPKRYVPCVARYVRSLLMDSVMISCWLLLEIVPQLQPPIATDIMPQKDTDVLSTDAQRAEEPAIANAAHGTNGSRRQAARQVAHAYWRLHATHFLQRHTSPSPCAASEPNTGHCRSDKRTASLDFKDLGHARATGWRSPDEHRAALLDKQDPVSNLSPTSLRHPPWRPRKAAKLSTALSP